MTKVLPAAKLSRDGSTWLIYAQWGVYCYFLYTFAPSVALLRDDEHISDTLASLHSTAFAAGIVIVGMIGAPIIARVGRHRSLWLSLVALCAAICGYVATSVFAVSLTAILLAGAFGSFLGIGVAASLTDRHGPAGGVALAEANGIASAVGVVAPLAIAAAINLGYGWRPAMLLTLPLVGLLGLIAPRVLRPRPGNRSTDDDVPVVRAGRLPRRYWPSWLIVVLCVSLEFCLTLWSPLLLRDRLHLSAAAAATGITAVLAGMSAGRLLGARLAERRAIDWMLLRSFLVVALGFTVFWLATVVWLSYAGLVVCGLGIAMHYPLGVARAIAGAPGQADLASSRLSVASGVAIGAGPFLLAFLADTIAVRWAFLLVPVLLTGAAATVLGAREVPAIQPDAEPALPARVGC